MSSSSNSRGVERADVEHADHVAAREQRHAEQRLDPLLAQDRVEHVGVVDVVEHDRPPQGRDAAREAAPDRDAHARLHLLLDPEGRARDQLVAHVVEQQDRRRVHVQEVARPCEERSQQVVELEVRQSGVGEPLQTLQAVGIVPLHLATIVAQDPRGRRGAARMTHVHHEAYDVAPGLWIWRVEYPRRHETASCPPGARPGTGSGPCCSNA